MTDLDIIHALAANKTVFQNLLTDVPVEFIPWRPQEGKWCLLEIVCHLVDEEREDFRDRTMHILNTPDAPLPPIDPQGWVTSRNYIAQSFSEKCFEFIEEREKSIQWLQSLSQPMWTNAYQHPKFGPMSARMFLNNWLAHDYLHMRQILKLKYDYLLQHTEEDLGYAGAW